MRAATAAAAVCVQGSSCGSDEAVPVTAYGGCIEVASVLEIQVHENVTSVIVQVHNLHRPQLTLKEEGT